MITGSIASSYHGEPRSTQDIDVVIDPSADQLRTFIRELVEGTYYVDADVAEAALLQRTQFNAIAPDASKVDLIIRKDRPFSVTEFNRRRRADLLGTRGSLVTADDLVLAKLEWAQASGSDRQLHDIAGILVMDRGLDQGYIDHWANELGVSEAWRQLKDASDQTA